MSDKKQDPEDEEDKTADSDSYMPTDDATNVAPGSGISAPDNAELVRFQSEAAAKERALAEGFDAAGDRFRLFELSERQAVKGETVRWEIRNVETDEVAMEGGPLFLDHPAHSDHALADARGRAYAALRDMCDGQYRDLRGSKKMADDTNRKKELLRKQFWGQKLTVAQLTLVADIEAQIADLSDEFITAVGGILKQDWDPGSSWEVVEADGASKLVRKETRLGDDAPTKHAYREGQTLRIDAGVVPEDVVVRECLGDSRYRVQSLLNSAMHTVDEADLYDPANDSMFDGPGLDLADVAKLF